MINEDGPNMSFTMCQHSPMFDLFLILTRLSPSQYENKYQYADENIFIFMQIQRHLTSCCSVLKSVYKNTLKYSYSSFECEECVREVFYSV